jgi:hypothetical protein
MAAAIVVYKEDMSSACKIPACSPAKVKENMMTLFELNHLELVPRLINSHAQYLY